GMEERRLARAELGREPTPAETSRGLARRALAFGREHPSAWLALEGKKALRLVSAAEPRSSFAVADRRAGAPWLWLVVVPFPALAPLGRLAGALRPPPTPARAPLAAYALVPVAVVLLFFMTSRYRAPLAPPLAALAGAGLLAGLRRPRWLAG